MVRIEASKTINAPAGKVFSLITDFESLPSRFPKRYRSVKVIERSDGAATVEEDVTIAGREIHQVVKHTFERDRMLRSEVVRGDTKGTVVQITLAPDSSRTTKVSVDADLKLGKLGAVLGIFAKGKIKGGLGHMIQEFENKVNSA